MLLLSAVLAVSPVAAFVPNHPNKQLLFTSTKKTTTSTSSQAKLLPPANSLWSQSICDSSSSSSSSSSSLSTSTQLSMAFRTDKPSNMFDGPMALTKERDACGVGFIINAKTPGRFVWSGSS
jgi:hypothetical protein